MTTSSFQTTIRQTPQTWLAFLIAICGLQTWINFSSPFRYYRRALDGVLDEPRALDNFSPRPNGGFVACVTDRQSVLDALVLAESIYDDWDTDGLVLEFHHQGTLSRYLQGYLETSYPFVTVVDLSKHLVGDNNTCLTAAFKTTKLRNAISISPSMQFLQDPNVLLREVQENQRHHCHNRQVHKFVSYLKNITDLPEEEVDGICLAQIPLNSTVLVQHKSPSRTIDVASIEGTIGGKWISLQPSYLKVISFNHYHREAFEYSDGGSNHSAVDVLLQKHWLRQAEARRILSMDRPMEWVAFDAGFHADDSSTLNTLGAANRSLVAGSKIINIDIALTADHQLVAVHNDKSITPADFQGSKLNTRIAKLTAAKALGITNPCLPHSIVRSSLLPNPYQSYKCKPEPVSLLSDFIDMVKEHNNKHHPSPPTELILDLKAPKVALQVEQARILARSVAPSLQERQLAVRFFSVFEEDRLAATVFPEEALKALATDPTLDSIAYYVNVPSSVACLQIADWIQNNADFLNKRIQGCYIILDHDKIAQSWADFAQEHQVNTTVVSSTDSPSPKMICDVPRKLSFIDPSLWNKEYNHCLSHGFDYIHDPFPPPSRADYSHHSLPYPIPYFGRARKRLHRKHYRQNLVDPAKQAEVIHFGYSVSPSDWSRSQFQWYEGMKPIEPSNPLTKLKPSQHNFRCVSKVLSVLLFLSFEERGYLSLDDVVVDGDNNTYPMTYRQVFSHTGGSNGTRPGETFLYINDLWPPIPSAFERQTGLRFEDAMRHYIIEPMGLQGYFDATNVSMPPYAARGYNGEAEDLVLIASTLASGGVSPKTRKKIVSPSSIATMLSQSITTPPLTESFYKDQIVTEMTKVYNKTGLFPPPGFVTGYGMGLWRVTGWRRTAQGLPIQGWLAQGSCFVYFDTTGLIVSFFPKGMFYANHIRALVKMISDLGDLVVNGAAQAATA